MSIAETITRWRHRHGFGVQSPWAYELVRDALCDHSRFYAFDTLGGTKRDEQLFRLAHWLHATAIAADGLSDTARRYLLAACPKLAITPLTLPLPETSLPDCAIVEDIAGSGKALWQQLLQQPQTTSAFDLRHRGIAFFDPARQRQIYLL